MDPVGTSTCTYAGGYFFGSNISLVWCAALEPLGQRAERMANVASVLARPPVDRLSVWASLLPRSFASNDDRLRLAGASAGGHAHSDKCYS